MAPKSASSSSSESESRSSSPETTKKTAQSSNSESEQDSSSGSSEGESDNESASSAEGSDSESEESSDESSKVKTIAAQPFKAPSGFKSVKKQSPPSSGVASALFDLRGKQIFHVSAPASLPLSKVKEISLAKVMQGEPVMKHDGVAYGIPAEGMTNGDGAANTLVTYDPKTQTYTPTIANNIHSYHVQELVQIPNLSELDGKVREAAQEQVVPPRKQPKHLKMRFRPVGSRNAPAETIGSSSEESEGEAPTFKVPKGANLDKEERKRKQHPTEAEENTASGEPRKKSKKHEDGEKKKSSKNKEEKKRKKSSKSA
ncbi:DNA-directed RNA polymerase I subunit RPA34 [Aspergillus affinis]|uniref:DNA-directed RNA polymerase I subunit RPA34 n=1 Tax=Aspergillus affinis TaxID=1070780 RepID=UPI0022FE1731|nr:uncharacterized protein KD926_000662 [Aspergillus affinis]KAI9037300.1 hypothetical protein KD926_000662 [Aspergillus affinis]